MAALYWLIFSTALTLLPTASSLYTDHQSRRVAAIQLRAAEHSVLAETARERAFLAQENAYLDGAISPRNVLIPSNAFNASPAFTSLFASAAIVGVALLSKLGDELRKMNMHVEDIRDELGVQSAAMIQGWQNNGYGTFIYDTVRGEIDDHGGDATVGRHAFYLYNRTTTADVVFKNMVRNNPFPPSFGGFSSDLEAIFRLMWANRQTLRATLPRDEADAIVFHLIVPAKRTIAILDRMVIHASIGKLVIKGHMDEGCCYAWFNFVWLPSQVVLHDVRNLNTDKEDMERSESTYAQSISGAMICNIGGGVSAFLCPPAVPFFFAGFTVFSAGVLKAAAVDEIRRRMLPKPRVLGPPPEEIAGELQHRRIPIRRNSI